MRQMSLWVRGEQQVFSMAEKVRYSRGIWTRECIENYLDNQFQKILISARKSKWQPVSSRVNSETSTL